MGITGLLPFVKNSCRPANIKDFAGATVAIDAYSWLHKGAFACAEKLVKGEKTDGYVYYCIKLLNMLLEAGVKPIMVFDGCNLASKAVTEKKRRENRDKTRQRGKELLCEGKVKEARECFQRCVDVTPEMAREVIQACKKKSVDCIVAPYEADAQMAYLDKIGVTQLTITEDSDLILFGCDKILFKMDSCGGGMLFEKENLNKSFGGNASKYSFEKFRYMCILSGCDYLPSLPGIGLAKACKFFSLTSITDLTVVLSKLPSYLKMPKLTVSEDYKDSFIKANNTFLYQLVFCPRKKCLVPLNPYVEGTDPSDMEYAGKYLDDDLAYGLAMGLINCKTLKKYDLSDCQSSSEFQENKTGLWSPLSDSVNSKVSKKETAFKFSTPKRKVDDVNIHKLAETDTKNENGMLSTEELYSMYGGSAKKSKPSDLYEEDPIFVCSRNNKIKSSTESDSSRSSPPVKNFVKSRFFSSEYVSSSAESSSGYFSSPSSINNSTGEDFLSDSLIITETETTELDKEAKKEIELLDNHSKSNKENIINRFSKKKTTALSPILNEDSVVSTTNNEKSVSVLDVFSTESTAATSTISSMQKFSKILSPSVDESSVVKIRPKNLFSKNNKKLITTKIQDYNLVKKKSSAETSGCITTEKTCDENIEKSLDTNMLDKSPLKEVSPYFLNIQDISICDTPVEESVITLSDCEDSEPSDKNRSSLSPKKRGPSHSNPKEKLGKCRSIGLSKKRKSSCTSSRKETLLNFNFTKQAVSMKSN